MARVAAIDCGTNSIRLLIADATRADGGRPILHDVRREMRIVRLGQGVDATGRLAPEALERTRVALAEYAEWIRDSGVDRVRMTATSATRDAANREDFFSMVRATLGVDAEVISGDEEARLSFVGAVGDLSAEQGPFVVADVGGGSTELVYGTWDGVRADVVAARSVDVGCVRLTERCLHSDPPAESEAAEARRVAAAILSEAFDDVDVRDARTWVGVAGTVTTLSAIAQGLKEYDPTRIHLSELSTGQIEQTTADLVAASHPERAAIPSMHPGRVDVIAGGAIVVATLAEEIAARAGIDRLTVSEHDILDGIALSLAEG
ncbi:exopolyphosphatase/guanosine-5'-triphosphate,3'-diphosphate pyrophosphatase [Actinoalloteichus hoggarensis]|uniref:Guanosine-5'-triphosphate,3'-diphosphate pyrophosphatase n=1 Tax=Actinoalloteichus hoggarensis TaxID=1470176 RepID=A0A221VXZ5_9PSEU|nr:Ppx/GppA phosphatase family protein [Actinoalloteichus hoggarensis]ASO18373.1 Guanosine-5'-triphosphate,3'-diphosphate pyrophosphatase [Actinoalloteichus hoggarensis]MBB5921737.1 exopolyphosphatase/guanosine-5'-triphosphate,3'-diphosphate pyrophosphatase [Actinoalloteichus hoggarensis]